MITLRRSLRLRLLAGTLVWIIASLALAGWGLAGLFRHHVAVQFRATLTNHLDQLTAHLAVDETGQPVLAAALSDPRLSRPYSGLYWQVDAMGDGTPGLLRSRSLWDGLLAVPGDTLADGEIHQHRVIGPDGSPLGAIERVVFPAEAPQRPLRLIVAADERLVTEPVERFTGLLAVSLGVLGLGLITAAVVQVVIGLRPLGELRRALAAVREGGAQRIEAAFPSEIQPLVDEFNGVLAHNARIVAHARTQAGNLAHALKTPLAILANAAARPDERLPQLVTEQVTTARRQVDYHLARARAAASAALPGARCRVRPLADLLIRVMGRLYADKGVETHLAVEGDPLFRGEPQDLQEMLGNLLDNAWKWAASRVELALQTRGGELRVVVDDDGPGLAAEQRQRVLARGVRADEQLPGAGLGLAIVSDLAELYAGALALETSPLGGLRVRLTLPAAATPPLPPFREAGAGD